MTKVCLGCGAKIQDKDSKALGYAPNINNNYCQRCFKIKHYNIIDNNNLNLTNEEIINKINKEKGIVFFLSDFLNLNNEVIKYYKSIKLPKIFVLTKSDLIPKNIKKEKLGEQIKKVYQIKEEVILVSSKNKDNLRYLESKIENTGIMVGITNAGKSSLINALTKRDLTVSSSINTTLNFAKIQGDSYLLIDTPGLSIPTSKFFKKIISVKTYQLESKYYLLVNNLKIAFNDYINLTFYISPDMKLEKRKGKNENLYEFRIPANSDIILKEIGFINVKKDCILYLNNKDVIEVRKSIVGGSFE